MNKNKSGFTLIELLIVVAIIAILAAIAVPNFLEAQLRAKIARAKSDMRTVQLGISTYVVDNNIPPHTAGRYLPATKQWNRDGICLFTNLTTPIAYLTSVNQVDPFASLAPGAYTSEYGPISSTQDGGDADRFKTLHLINIVGMARWWEPGTPPATNSAQGHPQRFLLLSLGPDYKKGPDPRPGVDPLAWRFGGYANAKDYRTYNGFVAWTYDPSNGTISGGDVLRWGD